MKALSFVTYCQNLTVINIYQLFHFRLCIEMFYSHMEIVYFMNLKAIHQLSHVLNLVHACQIMVKDIIITLLILTELMIGINMFAQRV